MKKLQINPQFIMRIPRFPLDADLETYWEALKSLIEESAQDFYSLIKDLTYEDLGTQPLKIQHTVWKYFNRARHRSTPFGGFAAVSLAPASFNSGDTPLTLSREVQYHEYPDWRAKEQVGYTYADLLLADGFLFTNTTLYSVGNNTLRFIGFDQGKFEIQEIDADPFVSDLTTRCRKPIPLRQVQALYPELDPEELRERIESLVAIQLLMTSMDSNIIGEDYFLRIGRVALQSEKYVISERQHTAGAFDLKRLKNVDQVLAQLQQMSTATLQEPLRQFIKRFRTRYDMQEVPLMLALDPQYGIGYSDLEQPFDDDDIIASIAQNAKTKRQQTDKKATLESFLSTAMKYENRIIDLEKLTLPHSHASLPLPNSLSLLFSLADEKVWIEHLGGVSACSLLGRFTLPVAAIHQLAKETAKLECEANPDVLFFDIGYTAEGHADNVNRRRSMYDQQLNILNYDCSNDPLSLADIMVRVTNDELILRSKSMDKRLIPRVASAYNYSRSDLALFRLLCDMQHQGVQSSLGIRLEQLFPNRSYYPRLQYQHYVVSSQKWRIKYTDVQNIGELSSLLQKRNIPKRVRSGNGDLLLYFDLDRTEDLEALLQFLRKEKELLLEETYFPTDEAVVDILGKRYATQYLATLTHREVIYPPLTKISHQATPSPVKRNFVPGSEWYSYELFCHPTQADHVLCTAIREFVEQEDNLLYNWFFIRYNEGGDHIRFRFRPKDPKTAPLNIRFAGYLERLLEENILSDVAQRTYRRELERYGSEHIDALEQHFGLDSAYVLQILDYNWDDLQKYSCCIRFAQDCLEALPYERTGLREQMEKMRQAYESEHHTEAQDFKRLNALFKKYLDSVQEMDLVLLHEQRRKLVNSFTAIHMACTDNQKDTLFSKVFHMHVNRLFPMEPRTHELAIYYIMSKLHMQGQIRTKHSEQQLV